MYRIHDPNFHPSITENGLYTLRLRYLERSVDGGFEDPIELFRRVAWNLATVERAFTPSLNDSQITDYADSFFRLMTDFRFLPNAPTLLGAGRPLQQLCACFVVPLGDSIHEIFDAVRMAALIHSKGGGTGFSFSSLRSRGTRIETGGVSTGPVSFLSVFDCETEIIKRGGTGWGANMGVLRCDHPDIREFIAAKSSGEGLQNFNLSVGVTDELMALFSTGGDLPLVDPHLGVVIDTVPARELIDSICYEAWKTGEPGVLFLGRINKDNPTPCMGQIEATNPCGEAPLLPFEACCLGGINVARFLSETTGEIQWDALSDVAGLALRMMDNVIEVSRFPLLQIGEAVRRTRKIGIGIMGFADLLIKLGIPYDSEDAEIIATKLMRSVQSATREMSEYLARQRGSFPAFQSSVWVQRGYQYLRNATTTSNAPNSTIGAIAGCSPGIEPLFAVGYGKHLLNGDWLTELHPIFLQLAKSRGFYSEDLAWFRILGS